ncbi:hypothetical protein XA68_13433 [Ophiocordyceps unilateralis]|uniref:Enterotoxin n=1 Tax=Ophiocordyceps unilateralis TaxID=268505 RepID=A0A2A9PCP4_OPHUN|nr:hypothetical protein XA68_13433 [Ophiocordyceps unilateralis]
MRLQSLVRFSLLVSVTVGVLAAEERVPYADDLTEGQGYNTFLGAGCMHGAVNVGRVSSDMADQVEVEYSAERITDYKQLVRSLDVGASTAMSSMAMPGIHSEGSISARFLDRSELERSFLTYLVRVDVRRQPVSRSTYGFKWTTPHNANRTYCDRFISGFVKGGALFARVSIITKDESKGREVDQSAKAAFSIYGINTRVTQSIKEQMDSIYKHSEVRIYLHYVGAKPVVQGKPITGRHLDLLRLKDTADAFLDAAKKHEWKRFAQLERYTNVPDFRDAFQPPDYSEAKDRSWSVLVDFSDLLSLQKDVRQVGPERYVNGRTTLEALDGRLTDALKRHREWVDAVSQRPEASRVRPWVGSPSDWRAEFLRSIRRTTWIAQRLRLRNGGWTDIMDKRLRPGAKKLFEIKAFGFGGVPGATRLVFGRRRNKDSYTCLLGRDVPRDWEVLSALWVFATPVPGYSNETVQVSGVPQLNSIQLRLGAIPEQGLLKRQETTLFGFYVTK